MPVPVFDWAESSGSSVKRSPRVARTQFGDGYVERAPDGLNPFADEWTLVFADASDEGAKEIEDFLAARFAGPTGQEAFDWTPLWATAPIRVVCSSWSRSLGSRPQTSSLQAVFEREYLA